MTKQWFNLGRKDEYGQQRRVEHRGRHLRISRTGGASLRAQTKAVGVNLTANSQHGVRVSRTIGRNTQLALQNGRLVFRGRYGSGASKLNVSRSGATVSTRNALGSFNWVKPNRSAAKLFGVQVRGKKAASLQIGFMLVQGVIALLELAFMLLLLLMRLLHTVALWVIDLLREVPFLVRQARRRLVVWRQRRRLRSRAAETGFPAPGDEAALFATAACVLLAWSRGGDLESWLHRAADSLPEAMAGFSLSARALAQTAEPLHEWQQTLHWRVDHIALVAMDELGQIAKQTLPPERLPELLLALDDLALRYGDKTILQEDVLAVFANAAGLRLVGKRISTREMLEVE